jgi:hypothetical protein
MQILPMSASEQCQLPSYLTNGQPEKADRPFHFNSMHRSQAEKGRQDDTTRTLT